MVGHSSDFPEEGTAQFSHGQVLVNVVPLSLDSLVNSHTWTTEQESHVPKYLRLPYRNHSCLKAAGEHSVLGSESGRSGLGKVLNL